MKKLPYRFNILIDGFSPLWNKFASWLGDNKTGHYLFSEFIDTSKNKKGYIIITEGVVCYNSPTITLEEWDEIVNGFKLPENWCIQVNSENEKVLQKYVNVSYPIKNKMLNFKGLKYYSHGRAIDRYTEITFEQFKKYVLKEEESNKKVYTIEDLSNGKVAVVNDGNIDELNTVFKAAFGGKTCPTGQYKYYETTSIPKTFWGTSYMATDKPTQSVKEFIKQLKIDMKTIKDVSELKAGDEILIENKPSFWSNKLNRKHPFDLNFPYKLVIKEIKLYHVDGEPRYAMTCGNYGWSLNSIIDAGCKLISRTENMEDNRFPFKLTVNQAQSIIDIACAKWKETLAELWAKQMLVDKVVIIQEKFYKEMREACTDEQNKLFDEIFGSDEEFKIGDWATVEKYISKDVLGRDNYKIGETFQISSIENSGDTKIKKWINNGLGKQISINSLRKATPEEIAKAQCPYEDGELCFVKDNRMWYLRYATGKTLEGRPTFYVNQKKTGYENTFKHHKSAKGVELPKD